MNSEKHCVQMPAPRLLYSLHYGEFIQRLLS